MIGKRKKKFILFALISTLLFSAAVAYGTEYWGSSSSYTAGSNKARQASYMKEWTSSSIAARTIVKNDAERNLPPGWLGVYPRAYYSNGSLVKAGSWSYTSSSASGTDNGVYVDDYTGYLYSQGRTALWNGTSYTTSTTTASPNAKIRSTEPNIMKTQLNSSGETFGSSLYIIDIEDEPDLILATGVDGTKGYVKKSDLYEDMAESPEVAVMFMNSRNANKVRVIPLYDSEGQMVIGEFEITPSNEAIQEVLED